MMALPLDSVLGMGLHMKFKSQHYFLAWGQANSMGPQTIRAIISTLPLASSSTSAGTPLVGTALASQDDIP